MTSVAVAPGPAGAAESFECRCPGCAAGLSPFSVEHFERWAYELVLDTGELWRVPPYFLAFVDDLYAGSPGLPKYPEDWLIVPEANAKTTSVAGLALHHVEHTMTAMVPWAASSREQAEVGYRQAEGLVFRTARLRTVFKPQEGYRRIKSLVDGGRMQVFAADDRTGDGIIPGRLAILDELHRQRDLRLYRTWRGKLGKRGAQILPISTAGEPGSEFEETREHIRQTATETHREPGFLRVVSGGVVMHEWAVPEGADVEDMGVVKAANPFDGITEGNLREKRDSPTMTLQHWRRFVCNLPTRGDYAAIQEAEWFEAETDEEIPVGAPIWLGLDVAWKWDTTAMVPFWMSDREHRLLGPARVLVPPRDGTSLDPNLVEKALLEIHARNPIHTVVMDMSRAEQLAEWIQAELGALVVERAQSNKFAAEDYDRFMEALRSGWLKHAPDRILTQHALNAVARVLPFGDAKFERPSQTRTSGEQDRRVIDALVAAAMVNAVAGARPPERKPSRLVSW